MRTRELRRDLRARLPVAPEVASGIAAGALVVLASLVLWGTSLDAVIRGVSLGICLGITVWLPARRRRMDAERRDRALVEQRLRLARELHDTVAGQVSVIGIQAAAARHVMRTQPDEAEAALERIEAVSRAANADLRRMLDALRGSDAATTTAAEPGLAQLEDLAASMDRAAAPVTVTIEPGVRPLADVAVDRAAYRIVHEALTNVRRHAGDAPVAVQVRRGGGMLRIDVVNGPGSRGVAGAPDGDGFGLAGIRERASLLGGSADAGPVPGGGFAVRARLPMSDE